VLIEYLSRATGDDLSARFEEWGFVLEDFYRTGSWLAMDPSDGRDEFLTSAGASRVLETDDGPVRAASGGEFVATFPVRENVGSVRIELRWSGKGRLLAGDTEIATVDADAPVDAGLDLDDPTLWSNGRLALRFRAGGTEAPLSLASLRIRSDGS